MTQYIGWTTTPEPLNLKAGLLCYGVKLGVLTSQKLYSGGVAVGGALGTRGTHVQGHVGHLGMV